MLFRLDAAGIDRLRELPPGAQRKTLINIARKNPSDVEGISAAARALEIDPREICEALRPAAPSDEFDYHLPTQEELQARVGELVALHMRTLEDGRAPVHTVTAVTITRVEDAAPGDPVVVHFDGPYAPHGFEQGQHETYEIPSNPLTDGTAGFRAFGSLGPWTTREVWLEDIDDPNAFVGGHQDPHERVQLGLLMDRFKAGESLEEDGITDKDRRFVADAIVLEFLEQRSPLRQHAKLGDLTKAWSRLCDQLAAGELDDVPAAVQRALVAHPRVIQSLKTNLQTPMNQVLLTRQLIWTLFRHRYDRAPTQEEQDGILERSIGFLHRRASLNEDVFNTLAEVLRDTRLAPHVLQFVGEPGQERLTWADGADAYFKEQTGVGPRTGQPDTLKCPALAADVLTGFLLRAIRK